MTLGTKDQGGGGGYLKQPEQSHETQLGILGARTSRTKNINSQNTDKKRKSTSLGNQINLCVRTTAERSKLGRVKGQEQELILSNFSPINLQILDIWTRPHKSNLLTENARY